MPGLHFYSNHVEDWCGRRTLRLNVVVVASPYSEWSKYRHRSEAYMLAIWSFALDFRHIVIVTYLLSSLINLICMLRVEQNSNSLFGMPYKTHWYQSKVKSLCIERDNLNADSSLDNPVLWMMQQKHLIPSFFGRVVYPRYSTGESTPFLAFTDTTTAWGILSYFGCGPTVWCDLPNWEQIYEALLWGANLLSKSNTYSITCITFSGMNIIQRILFLQTQYMFRLLH